jgi:hypothetical protein
MKSVFRAFVLLLALFIPRAAFSQAVAVTLTLDKPQINVGETTALHVLAQIVPVQRANSDRIFSWYVDLLDLNGAIAKLQTSSLSKAASDNNPAIALSGTVEGDNIRGIFDTFMGLAGAGRDSAVELLSMPVKGVAAGKAMIKVQAGTGEDLAEDFIVAPLGGGEDPLTGGDYSNAQIELQVSGNIQAPRLTIVLGRNAQTQNPEVTLKFTPAAGINYFIEASDSLGPAASWQPLSGAPHNSGQIVDPASAQHRFYRVRAVQ